MLFLTHLLAVLGFLSLLLILWRARSSPDSSKGITLPPEQQGAWPIIGHLHLLGSKTPLARTLASMADKQGPMFRIWLGVRPATIISSREAVRECFTTRDKDLASRAKSKAGVHLGYGYAAFAFAEYGDFWREMRKITMLELLSTRRLDDLKHVQASEIDAFIKDLHTLCRANTDNVQNGSSKVVIISEMLELLTLNIIIRMIANKRYFGLSSASAGSSINNDEASHLRKVIKDLLYIAGFPAGGPTVGTVRTMKRVARELDEIIGKWVEEHKLKRDDAQRGEVISMKEDFIDVMLSAIKEDGFNSFGHSPETIVKATVMNIIVAASDTTSLALTWVMSLLLNNKHVLKRAQEEIDLKVGRDEWVQDSNIESLPYLQAIVKETLRLYPPAPILVPHEAREECTIGGYLIPKGTWIFINAWKLHRDPRVWSDPEKFLPERFLTSHSGVDALGQHFEFIPFGSGRRSCPGDSFALQVIHLTLARLLQGFDLATPSDEAVDMTEGLGVNLPKATPLEAVLTPRLPPKLYEEYSTQKLKLINGKRPYEFKRIYDQLSSDNTLFMCPGRWGRSQWPVTVDGNELEDRDLRLRADRSSNGKEYEGLGFEGHAWIIGEIGKSKGSVSKYMGSVSRQECCGPCQDLDKSVNSHLDLDEGSTPSPVACESCNTLACSRRWSAEDLTN
ncbi:hypothetical protein BT93_H0462 [Corymbia citriodora subsp. variegata]|nr:hypothetical protein BT93_H0462 [Corymbia citriodora subsp. variegata]